MNKILTFAGLWLACCFSVNALAQAEAASEPLVIAVAPCPPFVMVDNGNISGLGIFLWQQIAQEMNVSYEFKEATLVDMLHAIAEPPEQRRAQVGISCLSITAERERTIDFSHSFFETYVGIAVKQSGMIDAMRKFFSNPAILQGLAMILAAAVLVGGLFFALEHRINNKIYSMEGRFGRLLEALILGLLFVTRGPIKFYEFKTLTARVLAALLAVGSTFMIAGITAMLASAFTLEQLSTQVSGLQDLNNVRVGALDGSTSSLFLRKNGIAHQTRSDLEALIDELDDGRLDAVVSDAAFLKYALKTGKEQGHYQQLTVLPYEFDSQNYGFAVQQNSALLEPVNQALLTVRKSPEWRTKLREYIGE